MNSAGMGVLSKIFLLFICIFSNIAFGADNSKRMLIGNLEIIWGDSLADHSQSESHKISIVDGKGRRFILDEKQALRASPDLYKYNKRMVAVIARRSNKNFMKWNVEAASLVSGPTISGGGFRGKDRQVIAGNAVLGATTWITLLCKYSDYTNEYQTASFYQSRYGSGVGQLGNYWQEVSYGNISLSGSSTYGWFSLPFPRSYYVRVGTDGKEHADLYLLAQDCATAADLSVNFSAYPNLTGLNLFFNWDLEPGWAWGGSSCVMVDGVQRCLGMTWNPSFVVSYTSWWAHEMGHGYGLPHANNSDGDSDPYDNPWETMSAHASNTVIDPIYGNMPKHLSMYSRDFLGWVDTARKLTFYPESPPSSIVVERASLVGSTQYQLVELRNPRDASKYYAIEVRMRSGYYESALAGNAVIIHEVMPSRLEPAWSLDLDRPPADISNNEGTMFKVGERWISPDRTFCVGVKAETTNGFVINISNRCQIKSRPGGAMVRSSSTISR